MNGAVVVPTYGRTDLLVSCLESLADLAPAPELTVIVDGNERPAPLPRRRPAGLELIRETNRGAAHARNVGMARVLAAGAEVVCFIDDDAMAPPDWFRRHLALHDRLDTVGAVGGGVRNLRPSSTVARYVQQVVFRPLRRDPGPVRMVPTVNVSYKAECLKAVGPWSVDFTLAGGEDVDHCQRVTAAGWTIHFEPELVVGHHHPQSMRGLVRQQRAYGRGFAKSRHRWPELPGADLLTMPWWQALGGTVPHTAREALATARELGPRHVPASLAASVSFRAAALRERRRLVRPARRDPAQ